MDWTMILKVCCRSNGEEAMHEECVEGSFNENDRENQCR